VTISMKAMGRWAVVIVAPVALTMLACTNLDENPQSFITPANFYGNQAEALSGLAGVYAQLRAVINNNWWSVDEITTDEIVVPTRGSDWYDNGQWLDLFRQTFNGNSAATLNLMDGVWIDIYTGVTRANALLEALENVSVPNQAQITAEARTLRAFYYYLLMDMWGGVPLATTTEIAERPRVSRDSLFNFITSELTAAEADLPDEPADYGRVGKGAADAILANMYLNAAVFTQDDPSQLDGHYNSCMSVTIGGQNACQLAVAAADRVLNSGVYSLAANFKDNFSPTNYNSPENIFVANFADQDGLGLNFVMRALHYNQFTPAPWNGFATLAATYDAFDSLDERRQDVFLAGPQNNVLTGQPVNDRQGNPLVFTATINDITAATEGEGIRYYKWPADPNHVNQDNGNDYAFFRLGEIYLIKAEALNEMTPGDGTALQLVNDLRARAFNPPKPLASIDRNAILSERLFELTFEAKRRDDLIRFGKFTQAWQFKPATDARVILLPIPQPELDANPELTQNPGY
jgi:hypothetical protein